MTNKTSFEKCKEWLEDLEIKFKVKYSNSMPVIVLEDKARITISFGQGTSFLSFDEDGAFFCWDVSKDCND